MAAPTATHIWSHMQDEALDGAHVIRPVAHIKTPYPVKFGVPRQPGLVDALEGVVYFEPEFRDADAVRGLVYGEAAAVQYNAASIILMMRIDPLQVSTLDALRTQILSDMKGDELEDALTAYGSTLENDLSTSAMNKMPASKIVNPSSSSNS